MKIKAELINEMYDLLARYGYEPNEINVGQGYGSIRFFDVEQQKKESAEKKSYMEACQASSSRAYTSS